jgi:hypothetical protein
MNLFVVQHELLPGSIFDNSKNGMSEIHKIQDVRASPLMEP